MFGLSAMIRSDNWKVFGTCRPVVVLDQSKEDLKSKEETRCHRANAALSDLLIYRIIAVHISVRGRSRRWPNFFLSSGGRR